MRHCPIQKDDFLQILHWCNLRYYIHFEEELQVDMFNQR